MNFRSSIDHTLRELVAVLSDLYSDGIVASSMVEVEMFAEGSKWALEKACDVTFSVALRLPHGSESSPDHPPSPPQEAAP